MIALYPPTRANALPIDSLTLAKKLTEQLGSKGCSVAHIALLCAGCASCMMGKKAEYCDSSTWLEKSDAVVMLSLESGNPGCGNGERAKSGSMVMSLAGGGSDDFKDDVSGRKRLEAEGRYRLLRDTITFLYDAGKQSLSNTAVSSNNP